MMATATCWLKNSGVLTSCREGHDPNGGFNMNHFHLTIGIMLDELINLT